MRDLDNDFADPNAKDIGNIPEVEMKKKYIIEWSELNAAELSLIPGVEESDKLWDVDVHAKPNIPGTRYQNRLSPQAGVLLALSNYGKVAGGQMAQRWSTVVGQMWIYACAKDNIPTSSLRWIFRKKIDNAVTISVLKVAMTRAKVNLEKQPSRLTAMRKHRYTVKRKFTRSDPSFYSIVGTPNGNGIPHLLRERRDLLGKKNLRDITVFVNLEDPRFPEWHILFGLDGNDEEEENDCNIM